MHLKQASVRSIRVVVKNIDLAFQLLVGLDLVSVLTLDFLRQFVLFVQRLVLALDDVHLEDGASGILLRSNDLHLASMVLDFRHNVDEHLL